MASESRYNALIKSMPNQQNVRGKVIGKILLSDLNLVPPKWTMLFRGKKLSRDVSIAKLLCSPKDPIVIYEGTVKPPTFRIDISGVAPSEEKTGSEVEKIDNEETTTEGIGTDSAKSDAGNCDIGAEMEYNSDKEKISLINLKKGLRFTEIYKVFLEKNRVDDNAKMAFVNTERKTRYFSSQFESTEMEQRRENRGKIIEAKNSNTVKILKQRICAALKVDAEKHNLFYMGKKLVESEKLESLGLVKGSTVKLDFKRSAKEKLERATKKHEYNEYLQPPKPYACGCPGGLRKGPPFKAQNVDGRTITMCGETPTHQWNLYSFGMTLYGTCSNKLCVSRKKMRKNRTGVSHIAGYGNILLTPERIKFPCSACKEMFPVKEFVLCGGRALFRFKKSGVGEEVKTVVMESEDDLMKYKTFERKAKHKDMDQTSMSSYDFIEITTVKSWAGIYCCVKCDEMIKLKQDENVLSCGHAYHNECTTVYVGVGDEDSIVGCDVCNAEEVESVYDMLGVERDNSDSEAALVRRN